jgi:excisionase family DNA binding protein
MSKSKKLIKIKEVSERIGMSEAWIYARMKDGMLPFPRYPVSGGGRRCDSAEVDTWLESIKVPAATLP